MAEQATIAEEEYLQTMFWLMEAGLPITGANIARAMHLSPPTVHEMLGRLEEDGYVVRADDRSLRFSAEGERHARAIVSRHRLIERFLTDVVGIEWDDVHEEAEKLEHATSPAFEQWMISAIGDASTCPHGHPIDPGKRIPGVPLSDVEEGASIEVLRFENEAEDVLHYLKQAGFRPGLAGRVESGLGDEVAVEADGTVLAISRSVAETVSVKADPSPPPRTALPEQLVLGRDRYGR
jgi:DtxR family Mn-dependent transcriptional regulator